MIDRDRRFEESNPTDWRRVIQARITSESKSLRAISADCWCVEGEMDEACTR